eukprot:12450226-Heterocapsa_arctica.AAC.1
MTACKFKGTCWKDSDACKNEVEPRGWYDSWEDDMNTPSVPKCRRAGTCRYSKNVPKNSKRNGQGAKKFSRQEN